MAELSAWFEEFIFGPGSADGTARKNGPAVITVIGSGGKTSLIWLLARALTRDTRRRKILVTPATKMFVPAPEAGCFDRYFDGPPPESVFGVTLAGRFNKTNEKLESLPPAQLERIVDDYDVVLVEGDGSKGLLLKGWAEHEPVVPSVTRITVGVIPLRSLGLSVSEKTVHRLPLFRALSGAKPGESVNAGHLAAVIQGSPRREERSLFSAARGRRVLFFNQAEDGDSAGKCRKVIRLLSAEFRSGLDGIIAGSVTRNVVWKMQPLGG